MTAFVVQSAIAQWGFGPMNKLGVIFIAVVAAIPVGANACADGYSCAVVRETSDGSVNIRVRPNSSSQIRQTLKPYEIVVISISDCAPNRDTDPWTEIVCVPRTAAGCDLKNTERALGWVNSRLLSRAYCPTDLNR